MQLVSDNFKNVTVNAGDDASFYITKGNANVNYTDDGVWVDTATALTLTDGTINSSLNNQIITTNNTTLKANAGTITVNYNNDSAETTVTLDEKESVILGGNTISADSGNITVKANDSAITIEGVDDNEQFSIDNQQFTKSALGLIRDGELLTDSGKQTSFNISDLISDTNWIGLLAQKSSDITIKENTAGIFVDNANNPTVIYGQIDSTAKLTKYDGATNTAPNSITVDGTTLAIDKLAFGTIPVKLSNASTTVTCGTDTITGKVDKVILNTMTFTPIEKDTFSFNGTDYVMYSAGLTRNNTADIWANAVSDNTYTNLTTESNWLPMLKLESDNETLNLTSTQKPTSDSDYVIVDNALEKRIAKLTYNDNNYTFKDGNIKTIQLPTGDLTVSTDFESSLEMTGGKLTVTNGSNKIYDGTALKIAATTTTSTLYDGTVNIATASDYAITSGKDTITVTTGTLTATAQNATWKTFDTLQNNGEFSINGTAYQVLGTGNKFTLIQKNSDGDLLYKDFITTLPFDYSNIAQSNFKTYVQLTEDRFLDLTKEIGNGEFIVVQNGSPTARVANLTYDGGFTLTKRDDCSPTAIAGVSLSSKSALRTFSNNIAKSVHTVTVTTTDTGEYNINNVSYYAVKDSTFDTYKDTSILTQGTVTLSASQAYSQVNALNILPVKLLLMLTIRTLSPLLNLMTLTNSPITMPAILKLKSVWLTVLKLNSTKLSKIRLLPLILPI